MIYDLISESIDETTQRIGKAAEPIMSFLAFVEADHKLAGVTLADDDVVCYLNVAGGSTQLTIGHLRALRKALYGS